MKLLIVTAIWKRHALTRIVLDHYAELARDGMYDIELLVVGSEGTPSRKLAEDAGWNYVKHENQPLSWKFNALFREAKQFNPDLLMLVGSDDLAEYSLIDYYMKNCKPDDQRLLGLKDIYFYSIQGKQLIYFPGYGGLSPKTIGAGRIFSRRILEMMGWMPWAEQTVNRGLDTASTIRMKRLGIEEQAISMEEAKGIICDFKMRDTFPRESLTPFHRLLEKGRLVDSRMLELVFPGPMEKIKNLNNENSTDHSRMDAV